MERKIMENILNGLYEKIVDLHRHEELLLLLLI